MFGLLDEFFDFDDDGELDAMEQGAEFGFLDELTKEEKRNKLIEMGLDPDDYDLD